MSRKKDSDSNKTRDAKEVAAFIAKGLSPIDTAAKVDLPVGYVHELTRLPEFEAALHHVGGDQAVASWNEYSLEREASGNLRTKVRERLNDYFDILDTIASNPDAKPETRFAVIKELLAQARISDEVVAPVAQELPPSFFTSLASALDEYEKWEAKKVK
jgi:hypothetical protein